MPHLPSLPADAQLADVFRRYPATTLPIVDYHEVVMRGPSPLPPGERELIAAYVSGLNACDYCHGTHALVAERFGVPDGLLAALLADLDTAPVEERMRPLLRYVATLTRTPARLTDADARAVLDAGWDEQALHDAIMVCALFNFMNRVVEGHGIACDPRHYGESAARLHTVGYAGTAAALRGTSP